MGADLGTNPDYAMTPASTATTTAADKILATVRNILEDKGWNVFTIGPSSSVYDAVVKMDETRVGALFVVDGDALIGVVSERDYTRKIILQGRSSRDTTVAEIMSSPVVSVDLATSLGQCMHIVTDRRVRHLAVVEAGRLVGVVTIGDLVRTVVALQAQIIERLNAMITDSYPD